MGWTRLYLKVDEALDYLRQVMPGNKALGLLAQFEFNKWLDKYSYTKKDKFFPGCWIVALKNEEFYALRTCFFVHSEIINLCDLNNVVNSLKSDRRCHVLFSSLKSVGLDVIYSIPIVDGESFSLSDVTWKIYRYTQEDLVEEKLDKYFSIWKGRGRPSRPREWSDILIKKYKNLSEKDITQITLPQFFYNDVFKKTFKASTMDPYDSDGFVISYSGKIFPLEIKEKFPFNHQQIGKTIGIDVGRVLLLLRICVPLNMNAFYIVREVEETSERKPLGWKIICLNEILMKCSWNVQAGGPGMASSPSEAGSPTSTILLPYREFTDMTPEFFSEENLMKRSSLTDNAKAVAREFLGKLSQVFEGGEENDDF
jgi:hypothetical protein